MASKTYPELLELLHRRDHQLVAMYPYGSRVYETAMADSDSDYITVLHRMPNKHQIIDRDNCSFIIHDKLSLQHGIWAHEPYALECLFLPKDKVLKESNPWDFTLNLRVLRETFSQKASHSFVKAKKKIDVEKDIKRGKKSLFHSLRIITFGIQIATHGKIVNYQEANPYWWDIWTNPSTDWLDYQKAFRPIYNGLSTKFREVCPK